MYKYHNYITQSIYLHDSFCQKSFLATLDFFNSIEDVFFKDKSREVKVYRTLDNKDLYILEKKVEKNSENSSLQVFVKPIKFFEKKESIASLMTYPLMSLEKNNQMHESCVMLFSKQLKTTSSLLTLRNYMNLLKDNKYLKTNYSNNFYKSLVAPLNEDIAQNLDTITQDIEHLYKTSKTEGFVGTKKAFEFNDLDNHVYLQGSKMMVTDQNRKFCVDIQDNKNITVYLLSDHFKSITKEIQKIDDDVKNGTIDEISNVILQVKNGKVNFVDNLLYEIFEMDIDFSLKALKDAGLSKRVFPVDIYSYEYQKNYYFTKYNLSEFEFLAQAFLTLGGGFDYDQEKGILVDDEVKYFKNIKKEKSSDKKFTKFNYCYPKKISHLNKDWTEGLKTLIETLKRDMPKPVAFDGDEPLDAVKKAIKYYEIKLSNLEKLNKLEETTISKEQLKEKVNKAKKS